MRVSASGVEKGVTDDWRRMILDIRMLEHVAETTPGWTFGRGMAALGDAMERATVEVVTVGGRPAEEFLAEKIVEEFDMAGFQPPAPDVAEMLAAEVIRNMEIEGEVELMRRRAEPEREE